MKKALFLFSLFILSVTLLMSQTIRLNNGDNSISVLSSSETETILQYDINHFEQTKVEINGSEYYHINLPKEGITQAKGMPELPVFNRSIIISNTARMNYEVYDVRYVDMQIPVAPSKGVITRDQNPAEIPYVFDRVYQEKNFYPANIAELSDPYIMRDFRGVTVRTVPFAYNPVTGTLRLFTQYKVRVFADGLDMVNVLYGNRSNISREFAPIYENHFVNWQNYRYTPVSDVYGKLLVICHTNYMSTILPYVNWKKQKGIETELIQWSTIGTTAAELQTYIQTRYNADNTIAYIQLVGDAPQIPSLSSGGGGADPMFSLVAGGDNYPDIFIGRFSAENTAQVTAQINKAIVYERDLNTSATWLGRAMGIASAEGGGSSGDMGESDIQHMNLIRTDLLGYGYTTVDQIYDPGASAATVTTNVNAGRGFINYVGHGSDTSWVTTGFSSTNATALTNGNMTPFIMDVACVNGNFVSITCFAEAWLRNANGGAVAMYASSINQSWNSPMRAQDECTDLLIAESKTTTGGLYYNSSCKMMDIYGNTTGSDGVNMFRTWHIFGDASLTVRSKTPIAMTVTHPAQIIIGATTVNVSTGVANTLVALTYNNNIYARGFTDGSGNAILTLVNPPASSITYTITATAFNRVTYIGSIQQVPGTGPYMAVTATTYADSNNNTAEYNETGRYNVTFQNIGAATATNVTATLTCTTPGISITDGTETIASLAAGASTTINNAYTFNIANNIANGTPAAFTITMVSGANTWTHNFSQVINAPALAFGNMTIQDTGGNNNGRLDPGETVTVIMPLNNTGAALSPSGNATLSCSTPGITVVNGNASFAAITAGGAASLSFTITASSGMTVGTVASLVFNATAGAYTANKTETTAVGLILEDFETGNFNSFPWTFSGNLPWVIDNTNAQTGAYSARSGVITHSQTSTMQTVRILTTGGDISFWYKVSSESGYDFLKFYVDGTVVSSWSGTVDWTQYTYALSAGTRTLKWEYMKDGSVDTGSDCAWVDNIIFPASTSPSVYNPPQNLVGIPGNGQVTLNWQAPVSGTPTGYKIYRNASLLTTVTGLTHNDTSVVNETTYNYYVRAAYSGGDSDPSNTVTVTPTAIPITEVILGNGTGTSGTQEGAPINIWYKSLHGQSVYTAAELYAAGVSGAQNITQIGFYIASVPTLALPNFIIRMKHTSETNVANWQTEAGMTTVYSNSSYMPVAGGYQMLTLSTPFSWNGVDNIVIDTAFDMVTEYSATGTVQYTSVTNGYRYVRTDTANQASVFTGGTVTVYRPNVKLSLQAQQTGPAIAVNPASVSETLLPGATTGVNITVTNTGNAALNWSVDRGRITFNEEPGFGTAETTEMERPLPAWLSASPSSGTVAAGGNATIILTLNATGLAQSTYNANLVINSNATNNPALSIPVTMTVYNPYPTGPRYVAEWEPAKGAIVRYPLGLPYTLLANVSQSDLLYVIVTSANQATANNLLSANGVNMTNVRYINASTDSYWTRDYGPWYIFEEDNSLKIVDFNYNRPRPNDNAIPAAVAGYLGIDYYTMPINHTGGNIMTDGMGKAMSTDLVLSENSSLSQSQINQMFSNYLGVTEYQIYPDPNNTYIDHIDCWGKLLDADKVMIRSVPTGHAQYSAIEAVVASWQTKTSSLGTPYRIYRAYTPNDEPYSNAFILNKKIYVPQMGTANDAAAIAAYQNAMPGYTVLGYSFGTFESTDAIHCRINTVFDEQMIALKHTRPTTATAYQNVTISVDIRHANMLDPLGTYVAWRHSPLADWQYATLNSAGNNIWTASIPAPALGQTIYYWIKATDYTLRNSTLPLCAGSDPYTILVDVAAPNTPPVINLPQSFAFDKNSSLTVDFAPYVSDADNDPLTLSICACYSINVQINGLQVTFSAPQNWVGNEVISFNVFDGTENATDDVNVIVNQIYMPPWTPAAYPQFATLHGIVTIESLPASLNDVVGAFVGEECRGVGEVRTQAGLAYVDFAVNLSGGREMVSFRIYDYGTGTYYPVLDDMNLVPGVEYGLETPVPINGTLQIVLAEPVVECGMASGNFVLQWSAVTYAQEYHIYRADNPYGPFTYIGTTAALQYMDTTAGDCAFYYVKAVRNLPVRARSGN
jgi:agmatine/peptidylarginine deiminase